MNIKIFLLNSKAKKLFICLLVVYLFGIANWILPAIRTTSAFANYILMEFIFFLPSVLSFLAFFVTKRLIFRLLLILPLIPVILCSLLLGMLALFPLTNIVSKGFDPSFERLKSVQSDDSKITVYRTDMGATTSFGIVARQERPLVPGILLVRHIYGVYPGAEAEVIKLGKDTIKIISPPYGDKRPMPDQAIIKLKPWVY
jgi:hypothetical protein